MKNRRILVTGSRGFIGQHILKKLREIGYDPIEWDKDIRHIQKFNTPVDAVIHLAGITQFDTQENITNGYEVNVQGTLSVLKYCKETEASFIFASTSAVYGYNESLRLGKETDAITPVSHYGISKSLAEMACKRFVEDSRLPCLILRLFNVYGHGQQKPFLIPDIIHSITHSEKIIIRTPNAVRDFIHVSDVVEAFINCLQSNLEGLQLFNIGTGIGTPISKIVDIAGSYSDKSLSVQKTPESERPIEYGLIADTHHSRAILNWAGTTDIRTGLKSLIKY